MTEAERSALRGLVAQKVLSLCEELGLKVRIETIRDVTSTLVLEHINPSVRRMVDKTDHTRGLCGQPDIPVDTPREEVERNPAHCCCCGERMHIQESKSLGMQQLGVYYLVCFTCPSPAKV